MSSYWEPDSAAALNWVGGADSVADRSTFSTQLTQFTHRAIWRAELNMTLASSVDSVFNLLCCPNGARSHVNFWLMMFADAQNATRVQTFGLFGFLSLKHFTLFLIILPSEFLFPRAQWRIDVEAKLTICVVEQSGEWFLQTSWEQNCISHPGWTGCKLTQWIQTAYFSVLYLNFYFFQFFSALRKTQLRFSTLFWSRIVSISQTTKSSPCLTCLQMLVDVKLWQQKTKSQHIMKKRESY